MSLDKNNRSAQFEAIAGRLAAAWLNQSLIEDLVEDELPQDRTEAYLVQDLMSQQIGQLITGWKVGATSGKMRELDGHTDVIPGRIFKSVTYHGRQIKLPIERFPRARVETEFAFRLLADCPVDQAPWSAENLIERVVLHPAIEIIGNRHVLLHGSKEQKSLMTIADNGGGIGFVFGEAYDNWQDLDFQNHLIRLSVDDSEPAENFLGELRGAPLKALADLLNHLAQRGYSLNVGAYVSTGATTVPQPFQKGSVVNADFGNVGSTTLQFG
ncbi:MAG: hydratase [Deltaproteobacteria bacterium]|nr:hydratase [Deltaproteobacteria bacterium]